MDWYLNNFRFRDFTRGHLALMPVSFNLHGRVRFDKGGDMVIFRVPEEHVFTYRIEYRALRP